MENFGILGYPFGMAMGFAAHRRYREARPGEVGAYLVVLALVLFGVCIFMFSVV